MTDPTTCSHPLACNCFTTQCKSPALGYSGSPRWPACICRSYEEHMTRIALKHDAKQPSLLDQLQLARQLLKEHGKCLRCRGKGTIEIDCSYCGDSTYDHYCNDRTETCDDCKGVGLVPAVKAFIDTIPDSKDSDDGNLNRSPSK